MIEESSSKSKWIITVSVSALVIFAIVWSLIPKPIPADIGQIKNGTFESVIVNDGMTRIKEKFVVSSPVDGVLPRVKWQEGDLVRRGQKLVTIQWNTDRNIFSPSDGEVLRVHTKDSGYINKGKPIMEIGDSRSLEIVVDVLTSSAVRINVSDKVNIHNWGGEQSLAGVVKRIEPSAFTKISALGVDEQRVNVIVEITSPESEWKSLGDQFQVECRIVVDTKESVLLAPTGALIQQKDNWAIYKVVDSKAHLQVIEIGDRGPDNTIVTSGLNEGDLVVVYPGDHVREGIKVTERAR